jgi:hypothetical protein
MSWRAQSRSKDASTPSVAGVWSDKPEPGRCPVQPYSIPAAESSLVFRLSMRYATTCGAARFSTLCLFGPTPRCLMASSVLCLLGHRLRILDELRNCFRSPRFHRCRLSCGLILPLPSRRLLCRPSTRRLFSPGLFLRLHHRRRSALWPRGFRPIGFRPFVLTFLWL